MPVVGELLFVVDSLHGDSSPGSFIPSGSADDGKDGLGIAPSPGPLSRNHAGGVRVVPHVQVVVRITQNQRIIVRKYLHEGEAGDQSADPVSGSAGPIAAAL